MILKSLYKVDILFFSYFAITTILLLISGKQAQNYLELLSIRGIIFIAVVFLIYNHSTTKSTFISLIRNTYPIIISGYFYSETVYYNKLFLLDIDPTLIRIEQAIFDSQPSISFSEYFSNNLFSELMYFGYFSFYLLIAGITIYIFFKRKKYLIRGIFLLSSALYIYYFIFALIPSQGPQFYFAPPDNTPPGAIFFDTIIHFIQLAEQPTGAFPSSHVGVSLIILLITKKIAPMIFKIILPVVAILILSTVYIRAHYVIDVIAAIMITPIIWFISNSLFNSFIEKER